MTTSLSIKDLRFLHQVITYNFIDILVDGSYNYKILDPLVDESIQIETSSSFF